LRCRERIGRLCADAGQAVPPHGAKQSRNQMRMRLSQNIQAIFSNVWNPLWEQATIHRLEVKKKMTTVLLVDDHPDVIEVTACMLEEEGYQVICATTPQQAQQLASERSDIDVVVTDLHLSHGLNGVEMGMAMRLKGLKCPLLVMSGGLEPERGVMQDWMSYLPKPFDRQSLLRKVTELACAP
jgi:CheY-like chemotaxis protein